MADDNNFRSYRSGDPARGGATGASPTNREKGPDPLAELARLIGQHDAFGDMKRDAARAPQVPPSVYRDSFSPPLQQPLRTGLEEEAHLYAEPMRDHGAHRDQDHRGYDEPGVHSTEHDDGHYEDESYDEGSPHAEQGDDSYEDAPQARPRRGLKAVMTLTALIVLGAGGAFAYRAMFGGGGSTMPPPVIKADTTPNKVVSAQSTEQSKLIYDRVGDASRTEKVVPREEQPVDINASRGRVALPEIPPSPDKPDSSATISSTLAALPSVGPASAEPKKVRTVTIRPDQPLPSDPSPAKSNAAPRNTAVAAVTPQANNGAFPTVGPRYVAPKPSAAPGANAPLAIGPQGAGGDAPTRPAPPPKSAAAPADAPTQVASASSGAEPGSYVQLSSQRSEPEAQASFRMLQSKFPALLNSRQPIIRRADLGDKGIYFRAMVGPFASVEEASSFCGSLKTAGGQCVVQRN